MHITKRRFRKEPLGQVLSDAYRVVHRRSFKLGNINHVMKGDDRSKVIWDDGTESVERAHDLTVIESR